MDNETRQSGAGNSETVVRIHGGVHDGATSVLREGHIAIVGSADDSDVWLSDEGVASHHLALGMSGDELVVRPMDGRCRINATVLRAEQSTAFAPGDRITIGDSGVWLSATRTDRPQVRIAAPKRRRKVSGGRAAVAVALVAALVGSYQAVLPDDVGPDPAVGVQDVLMSLQIADDVEVVTESGFLTLRGVLANQKFAALEAALSQASVPVVNRTLSVSLLLEQVRNVFRTNGYRAEMEYAGDGTVRITNLDGDNSTIREIAGRARDDVPALTDLTFSPFAGPDNDAQYAAFSLDPAKRLTTIVDGDTGLRRDRRRWPLLRWLRAAGWPIAARHQRGRYPGRRQRPDSVVGALNRVSVRRYSSSDSLQFVQRRSECMNPTQ